MSPWIFIIVCYPISLLTSVRLTLTVDGLTVWALDLVASRGHGFKLLGSAVVGGKVIIGFDSEI